MDTLILSAWKKNQWDLVIFIPVTQVTREVQENRWCSLDHPDCKQQSQALEAGDFQAHGFNHSDLPAHQVARTSVLSRNWAEQNWQTVKPGEGLHVTWCIRKSWSSHHHRFHSSSLSLSTQLPSSHAPSRPFTLLHKKPQCVLSKQATLQIRGNLQQVQDCVKGKNIRSNGLHIKMRGRGLNEKAICSATAHR